jgi:flagellar hook-length control protein FliK
MPVGANIRIAATSADPSAAAPTEPGSVEELFGEIIASLGEAAPEAAPDGAVPKENAGKPAGEDDIASFIDQLLSLASRQSAPADEADAGTEPSESSDTPEAAATTPNVLPIAPLPAPVPTVLAKAVPVATTDAAALPKAQVTLAPGRPAQPADFATTEPQPQIASTRTDTAVQQALSSLEAAVKGLAPQPWLATLPNRSKEQGQLDSAPPINDMKLTTLTPLQAIAVALAPTPTQTAAPLQAPVQAAPAEVMIEHQLDMAHEGEWLDQLARDIAQTVGSDKNPLRFRLNPETLGTLRVEITQDRNGAAVRLTADTEAARSIIADAQPRLISEARAQGIRISEAHVDLGNHAGSGDPRRQNEAFEEAPLRTARSLREEGEGDGNPTPGRSERYA